MGRKIPGRKHHGVRDPEKQYQQRTELLKDKINSAPSDPDDQQMPRSLLKVMELKDKVKSGLISIKRKRKHKRGEKPVTSHPFGVKPPREGEKPTPVFTQRNNESDRTFMHRVGKITHSVLQENAFENKYGVDIKRSATGEVEGVVKKKKDELETYLKQVKKQQYSKGKKKVVKSDQPKLTKSQKRSLKLKAQKEKKKGLHFDNFENCKDEVQFGEVVHEPPTLPAPKSVDVNEVRRSGQKDLLLKRLMNNSSEKLSLVPTKTKKIGKIVNRKGKRKLLPVALRRDLDRQQEHVMEAYKAFKVKKAV